jgi:hypothetical protein
MAITFNQASVPGLAGQMQFGNTGPDMWGETLKRINQLESDPLFKGLTPEAQQQYRTSAMTSLFPSGDENIVRRILENQERYGSKEYQEQMLEMADKYQTKKGIRQTAFNMFGSGFDNLMKGIGMSMNPYGTPEGLQNYLALTVAAPEAMAAGYRNLRTPMAIPAVQGGSAPTYF